MICCTSILHTDLVIRSLITFPLGVLGSYWSRVLPLSSPSLSSVLSTLWSRCSRLTGSTLSPFSSGLGLGLRSGGSSSTLTGHLLYVESGGSLSGEFVSPSSVGSNSSPSFFSGHLRWKSSLNTFKQFTGLVHLLHILAYSLDSPYIYLGAPVNPQLVR